MNHRNKLMGLSLIVLAAFTACTDEMENGPRPGGKGDHSLSFTASMQQMQTQTQTKAPTTSMTYIDMPVSQKLEPVEMEGKVDGKSVYLSTEVAGNFPTNDQPMTRGTLVTDANKTQAGIMETFAVSAYTAADGKPDFMYNVKTTIGSPVGGSTYWYPEENFYWPGVKSLDFYAWYPHPDDAEGLTVSGSDVAGTPTFQYTVPDDVKKQRDVMTAVARNQSEQASIPLTFDHTLAAVRFVGGDDLPNCVVKSVKLYDLQYSGSYDIASSTWTEILSDRKDFSINWGYNAAGAGSSITREDETLFMMPQSVDGKRIEVTFMKTDNTEFTVGANLSGTWEKGKSYTYRVSYNFVYVGVSNQYFVAYVDKKDTMKNQVGFYVNFSSSDPNDTRKISYSKDRSGLTITPETITPGSNIPIKVSWTGEYNWLYATMFIIDPNSDDLGDGMGKIETKLVIIRHNTEETKVGDETNIFEKDGGFWIYSLPETTCKPFKDEYSEGTYGDIIELQNVSGSDWLAITPTSTYNKDAKYNAIYDNSAKGDIYLQTLGIPEENRFASLLAVKEHMENNVMYCVQQKAISADFGFKGCERNISRESEKWNIVLSGGRFKEQTTSLEAKLVISDDVSAGLGGGTDLTYGDPVTVQIDKTTATGVSTEQYVKKRWDNQQNNTANNGTRKVNVQVKIAGSDEWHDVAGTGTMANWMTWGTFRSSKEKTTVFSTGEVHSGQNYSIWESVVRGVYENHYQVSANHPYFGKGKWQICQDSNNDKNTPSYRIWQRQCNNNADAQYYINGHVNGTWANTMELTIWQTSAYDRVRQNKDDAPMYVNQNSSSKWQFIQVRGIGKNDPFRTWIWEGWNVSDYYRVAVVPVIQGLSGRPTDTAPITGTSVNE